MYKRQGEAQPEADPAPSPAFRLPLRNVTNANILNYLTQERKLSPSLVNFFIAAGDIYEDAAHHNVVFVGRDADGHPRYASSRGIREKFRQDAAGAEKAFGFAHRGTDKQLLVFEAPIDLLSFIELFPNPTAACVAVLQFIRLRLHHGNFSFFLGSLSNSRSL